MSYAFAGDGYLSRGRVLLTGTPSINQLRSDRLGRIGVVSCGDELHLPVGTILCVRSCGIQRDGLELTLTLSGSL